MRHETCQRIPLIDRIDLIPGICLPNKNVGVKPPEMLQDLQQRRFSFFQYIYQIFFGILFSLVSGSDRLDHDRSKDPDRGAYKNSKKSFGQIALSSVKPGGGKFCQELPRLVTIIERKKRFCNVNLSGNLGRGTAAA